MIQIDLTTKILLGALYQEKQMNPIDYCMRATKTTIEALDPLSYEYEVISKYSFNTGKVLYHGVAAINKTRCIK